jgi:hypothetical protein
MIKVNKEEVDVGKLVDFMFADFAATKQRKLR